MIGFFTLAVLIMAANGQYNYQPPQGQAYQPQPAQYQPAPSYQPQQPAYQPQPQAYQPQPAQPKALNPAAVHYVNIGAELAGDYKFGYDTGKGADQSFREETRLADGTVQGAYGYVDETGKQRIIRYTAGKNGYQVEGDGIPKAPPAPAPVQPAPSHQAAPAYNGAYGGNQQYNNGNYY